MKSWDASHVKTDVVIQRWTEVVIWEERCGQPSDRTEVEKDRNSRTPFPAPPPLSPLPPPPPSDCSPCYYKCIMNCVAVQAHSQPRRDCCTSPDHNCLAEATTLNAILMSIKRKRFTTHTPLTIMFSMSFREALRSHATLTNKSLLRMPFKCLRRLMPNLTESCLPLW